LKLSDQQQQQQQQQEAKVTAFLAMLEQGLHTFLGDG
jgi:hypothetical protein